MATNVYDIGDKVRLSVTFTVDGVAADPTDVACKYQDPSGNEVEKTFLAGDVTRSGTGIYYYDVTIDESGTWFYRFEATGNVVGAGENHFRIRNSEF